LTNKGQPVVRARDEQALRALGWTIAGTAGVFCVLRDLRLSKVGDILSGASILTGFLFGTLVFAFQLRLRATDDPQVPNFGRLRRLIDQSFGRLTSAVVMALVTTALAVLSDVTAHTPASGQDATVSQWWTAALAVTGVRLMTLMPMLVWDLKRAYREIPG
jgi:hypothetical protein